MAVGFVGPVSPIIFRRLLSFPAAFLDCFLRHSALESIGQGQTALLKAALQQQIHACKHAVDGKHDSSRCACGSFDFNMQQFSVDDIVSAFIKPG